ncbi:MAG: hypothetical protein P4L72_08280 [Parvibaculum sp.]|jgi:hypothetical protein|uniref:hypothetical protein n=1 Tax=Parvibaculum sp. TaxID=2024848 RepID=UPI00283C2ACD|nr:hypothetical protein [Parvibaculum sp.]MDR3499209.1 hypothetical protein [Parvibaculum sp.]
MKKISGIVALAFGASLMMSGAAMALDSSFDAMSKSGKHQFYVWCTGGKSSVQTADGSNAKEAQAKLAASAGNSCWPVWQGLAG